MPERILVFVLVAAFFAVDAAAQGGSTDAQNCARIAPVEIGKPAYPIDPPPSGGPALPSEPGKQYELALAMESCGYAKEAVRVYRRAARGGHGKAARRLGRIFDCGVPGVPRDYAESLQWYDTARKLGESVPTPSRDGKC